MIYFLFSRQALTPARYINGGFKHELNYPPCPPHRATARRGRGGIISPSLLGRGWGRGHLHNLLTLPAQRSWVSKVTSSLYQHHFPDIGKTTRLNFVKINSRSQSRSVKVNLICSCSQVFVNKYCLFPSKQIIYN